MTTVVLVAMLFYAAGAGDHFAPAYSLSGVGTVGLVHSSEDQADYTNRHWYKPSGAGHTHNHNWSTDLDSHLGLQLDAKFTPQRTAVLQVMQAEGSSTRDEFYAGFTGKSGAQIKAHWLKIAFTDRGQRPKDVSNSIEVKKLVAENPNAIGYIEQKTVDESEFCNINKRATTPILAGKECLISVEALLVDFSG